MKKIIAYLLVFSLIDIFALAFVQLYPLPDWALKARLVSVCAVVGGLGGCIYCLRGVYLNASVRKNWDKAWEVWYYIRPIVSHFCGAVSFVFLKAGLLLLGAKQSDNAGDLGFLALSFIAGLNVDKFISKLEDLAQATWGIEKSRTAKGIENKDQQNTSLGGDRQIGAGQ
jgi:hypothetical protein